MKKKWSISGLITFVFIVISACVGEKNTNLDTKTLEKDERLLSQTKKPNMIFFLSDDQDVYDYGCYGNEKVKTQSIDQLANDGMLFENAFTAQAICAPSRSQLLTGKYPLKNGCFANHTSVKPTLEGVVQQMHKFGYEVVLAGKSHVKPDVVFEWDREWHSVEREQGPRPYIPLDSIKNYFEKTKKPFVMLITSYYPHSKYFDVENSKAEDIKFFPFNEDKKNNEGFIKTKAGYYRSIEEENKQLASVLKLVDVHLDKENTLFIYSADHGVSGKFTVKDVGLKVPFVVRWPNVIKPGTKSSQLIHYTDVLPTFMDIAGGKATSEMDGKSFLPILKGEDVEINKYVYGVRTNQNILNSEVFPSRMIRDNRYKYIRNFNSLEVVTQNLTGKQNVDYFIKRGAKAFKNEPFEELYDLQKDPFEENNLANKTELSFIKERLIQDMFSWMKSQGDFLDEKIGNMPIITPKGNKGFKLDKDTPRRKIADSLKNTLTKDDYIVIKHW